VIHTYTCPTMPCIKKRSSVQAFKRFFQLLSDNRTLHGVYTYCFSCIGKYRCVNVMMANNCDSKLTLIVLRKHTASIKALSMKPNSIAALSRETGVMEAHWKVRACAQFYRKGRTTNAKKISGDRTHISRKYCVQP